MLSTTLIQSRGKLLYSENKLILQVDQGISDFYRSMIPRYYHVQKPRYPAHISIIREEQIQNIHTLDTYNLTDVDFFYNTYIQNDDTYWWLNVSCCKLNMIRCELGLQEWSVLCRPPDGSNHFHITIANTKG